MTKRSSSRSSIPFIVFALLILTIVGFHLQKQQGNDSVLGVTSGAPIFSKEWFGEILSFFGLGEEKTETTTVDYQLPTYGTSQKSGSFTLTGDTQSDSLLIELDSTTDDGGAEDFENLQKDASGL